MVCISEQLRRERLEAMRARTAEDRIHIALELGTADAHRYAAAHQVSVHAARATFQRQRQVGRRASGCHESLLA